jgi:hypothetical protein
LESLTPKPAKNELKYWCEDETKIGLKTIETKKITALGVKPINLVQCQFKAYYLYGAVAPQTGENLALHKSSMLSIARPQGTNIFQLVIGTVLCFK